MHQEPDIDDLNRRAGPCPACGNLIGNVIQVNNAVLVRNRDAIFNCRRCEFRSFVVIAYRPASDPGKRNMDRVPHQRQYTFLEDGEELRSLPFRCSLCRGPAKVRTGQSMTPALRRVYAYCINGCDWKHVAMVEHVEQLSFPGAGPEIGIPYHNELIRKLKREAETLRERIIKYEY